MIDKIKSIDCSQTKKYTKWLVKQYNNEKYDIESLTSYIQEYHVLSERKLINSDIYSFNTISDLKKEIDRVNNIKTASRKELETDYDIIVDNDDILVIRPNTHEASRKLGLSIFKYRINKETGQQDSAWCTTYANSSHWDDYYYNDEYTFYYCKVKNIDLIKGFNLPTSYTIFACAVPKKIFDTTNENEFNVDDYLFDDYLFDDFIDETQNEQENFKILYNKNINLFEIYDAEDNNITSSIKINGLIKTTKIVEHLLPYNVSNRKEQKYKNNLKILNQEVIIGDLNIDDDFLPNYDIEVKCKEIYGSIYIDGYDFLLIPKFLKNIKVNGDFYIRGTKIKDLTNAPYIVCGVFDCADNELISLKGAPDKVYDFLCFDNYLTNLEGLQIIINDLDCSDNNLESLKGIPKKINSLNASSNLIQKLDYFPEIVTGEINLSRNKIESLKGIPSIIHDDLDITYNCIKSWEHVPIISNGNIYILHNPIMNS